MSVYLFVCFVMTDIKNTEQIYVMLTIQIAYNIQVNETQLVFFRGKVFRKINGKVKPFTVKLIGNEFVNFLMFRTSFLYAPPFAPFYWRVNVKYVLTVILLNIVNK